MQLPRIVQYVDVVGISIYPYVFFDHGDKGNPGNLPPDWLSQIETLSAGKPLAITETGWAAERLTIPDLGVDVVTNDSYQDAYLQLLFDEAENLDMQFIIWFAIADYNALWNGLLGQDDISRIWRDIGLFDGGLNPRPALTRWQQQLDFKLVE